MIQHSRPLPADIPTCVQGHRPQLVETRGAPAGHRVGSPCPPHFHIECHRCRVATVPSPSRAITELRWRDPMGHIPLSDLPRVRERIAAVVAAAA